MSSFSKKRRLTKGSGSQGGSRESEREEVEVPQQDRPPRQARVQVTPHECALWSDEEKKRYDALGRIKFAPTRFLSKEFLTMLEMKEDVEEYLTRMGLGKLAHESYPSYPELTRQFLATLEVIYEKPRRKTVEQGRVEFKVYNKLYTIPMVGICDAFGFDKGDLVKFPDFGYESTFWKIIGSNDDFNSGASKASLIRNPVIFMVHRFLANTIFPRMDIGKVKQDELYLLFQGVKHVVTYTGGHPFPDKFKKDVNLGCVLTTELRRHQNWCLATSLASPISYIGGILVPIFIKARVPLSHYTPDPSQETLDLKLFVHAKTIKPSRTNDGEFIYYYRDVEGTMYTFTLPNRDLTAPITQENIEFEYGQTETEQQEHEPQPQQQTTSHQVPTLESLFRNIQLRPIPFEPENEHERWFAEEHERQRRFNTIAMNLFSEYDRITGRLNQPSPAISGFSEFDDPNNDGEEQGGPSSPH